MFRFADEGHVFLLLYLTCHTRTDAILCIVNNYVRFEALWDAVSHRTAALDHGSSVMPIHGSKLKTIMTAEEFPDGA